LVDVSDFHFVVNNKHILCYVNIIKKKGKPEYISLSSMRLVLPQGSRKLVMGLCHSKSHNGSHNIYLKLERLFWCPDMCLSVAWFWFTCMQSQLHRAIIVAELVLVIVVMGQAAAFVIVFVVYAGSDLLSSVDKILYMIVLVEQSKRWIE